MRRAALLIAVALTATASANILDMPMDSMSPAGYITAPDDMTCDVVTAGSRTYVGTANLNGGPSGATFIAPVIDFTIFSGGTINAGVAGATLEFDLRYYQEGSGENGEQPYDPGQCELDVTLYDVNGQEWTWVDAFDNPVPHADWFAMTFDLADTAGNPSFDLTQVSGMALSGYNSRWCPRDEIGLDNLSIVPEPATASLLALGLLGLLRRR